jgi:hypothetical protein
MATTTTVYGTNTALTITLTSLANTSARQSTARDNSTTNVLDDLVGGHITPGATIAAPASVNIYVLALTDDGTRFGANGTGADGAFTMPTYKGNMRLALVVPINAASTAEYFEPFSVANLFGGILPKKYALVVENVTGGTLDATSGGTIYYQPITLQTA